MPEPTLHPNLARIAAAYDEILERLARRVLTPQAARAAIAQLEARDDDGVRWSIDPDTGQWYRRTAFGDSEFDAAPPTSGYMTADAHDMSPNYSAFNPSERLQLFAVPDIAPYPGSLQGATRRQQAQASDHQPTWQTRLRQVPQLAKAVALALVATALIAAAAHSLTSHQVNHTTPVPVTATHPA